MSTPDGSHVKPPAADVASTATSALSALVPAGRQFGMPDLIDRALAEGRHVRVHRVVGDWYDIGSHDEFHRVSRLFAGDGPDQRARESST